MLRSDFYYELPEALIAQDPPEIRGDSRLLYLDSKTGKLQDKHFNDLLSLVHPEDLLVFNDTSVIPARLFGYKETGGKVEILVERLLGHGQLLVQIRSSKSPKSGTKIKLENETELQIQTRQDDFYICSILQGNDLINLLEQIGHVPLPPYIKRSDVQLDKERYQTVFAKHAGAVAAPTAGLHFTNNMFDALKNKGVATEFVTLHVGAGTFQPVRTDEIEEHTMHSERFEITPSLCHSIDRTKHQGGRVIAVGTTVVRCLESAARNGELLAQQGETDIFIYPGFEFRVVDALITNFHLPESTLLMLVCAFAGKENIMNAYQHAIQERYRFFSYGDAMFIT